MWHYPQWTGYNSMTYELPADCYDGRVELQTLARRIARACVHFLQVSMRPGACSAAVPRVSRLCHSRALHSPYRQT